MDKDFYKLCQQKNDCLQAQYETERKYIYNKYNQEFTVLERVLGWDSQVRQTALTAEGSEYLRG